jgi:RNA polymerase sigma factor (TIGR02999 family)
MSSSVSQLVVAAESGNSGAVHELFAALYDELHRLAESHLRRQAADFTLGTTTLLHDAYLQMAAREGVEFPDKSRFFAYASRVMRGMVIDRVRQKGAYKRGGEFEFTSLTNADSGPSMHAATDPKLEALAAAMESLTALDASLAELVDLHFFCGFSFSEIAQLRAISERTVQRDWRKARLLLASHLDDLEHTAPT